MRSRNVVALALGLALLGQSVLLANAARKYYPPGFTPPSDQKPTPAQAPPEPQPQIIIQQVPGSKQVIIRTIPVGKPAKPRDPLLVLMDEHRYYDALRVVDSRLAKAPKNVSLQITRGRILREQGSFQASISQFQGVLEKNHSKSIRASAYNGLGWTYYQKALHDRQVGDNAGFEADLQQADAAFRQANLLAPSMSYAWAGLGEVALTNGQLKDAEQWIKKAKKLSPSNLSVQLAEAELLLAQKKPEEALQILYGIKKTTTHEPDVFLLLAKGSFDTGKIDDAIINLKQLLELVPDHTEALKLLSQSYELKMKPEDAEDVLEKAIALNPMDEKSVGSLLKIYDQRHETERGILLLKTLLKDRPGQAVYGLLLLDRLADECRWNEVYEEALPLIGPVLENGAEYPDERQAIMSLFSQAVYQKGRGMLDRRDLLKDPIVQQVRAFFQASLKSSMSPVAGQQDPHLGLVSQLNLLLLDPLAQVPKLPENISPSEEDLPVVLQIAFLQGNTALQNRLLKTVKSLDDKASIARQLYGLGDYEGALVVVEQELAEHPDSQEGKVLKRQILADQQSRKEQLASLSMLPRKIPDAYWQKAATDVLKLGSGDWQTHALLGNALEKRHHPGLALFHQRLAAQYAPTPKDRAYWSRRADKTARALSHN